VDKKNTTVLTFIYFVCLKQTEMFKEKWFHGWIGCEWPEGTLPPDTQVVLLYLCDAILEKSSTSTAAFIVEFMEVQPELFKVVTQHSLPRERAGTCWVCGGAGGGLYAWLKFQELRSCTYAISFLLLKCLP
jgi:hypothetical protein